MSRIKLIPYNMNSESANNLTRALGIQKIVNDASRSRFIGRTDDIIINWGCTEHQEHLRSSTIINGFGNVNNASSKLQTFNIMTDAGIPIPAFTRETELANTWLEEGYTVLGRDLTRGSGGRGIFVYDPANAEQVGPHRYYTKYIPKLHEYRVHVVGDNVLVNKKLRNRETPDSQVDWRIRNHDNGFIFGRTPENVPDSVIDISIRAVRALGLYFGAVDVIYNVRRASAYVLEINTAPGLTGQTVEFYKENISNIINSLLGD